MTKKAKASISSRDENLLLFGDNLNWLRNRDAFPDESIDLIYLDPPFNSNADYNMLFREESGEQSRAQFHAFTDTWHWVDAEETYREFIKTCPSPNVTGMLEAFRSFLGTSPVMAYLAMMAPRLVELHRVLKATGSLYLHCDPTAGPHLRVLLDQVFDPVNFRNEIVWKRTSGHSDAKRYGSVHDTILYYVKGEPITWNQLYTPYDPGYVEQYYRYADPDGRRFMSGDLGASGLQGGGYEYEWKGVTRIWRVPPDTMKRLDGEGRVFYTRNGIPRMKRYLDEAKGMPVQDVWTDVEAIRSWHKEKLSYPTQKPEALLERIILASSNEGETVLDPFCGCGTAVHAAQRLNRRWIGIDITYLAINLIKKRLADAKFESLSYVEKGQPEDLQSAEALSELDKFQFQQWALSLVNAMPLKQGGGKGADRGVDGSLSFWESKNERRKILVQVKGGSVNRGDVATLLGDVQNQKFAGGLLITLETPTKPMRLEAAEAGRYESALWHSRDYPKIQLLTIKELLEGARPDMPPQEDPFQKAPTESSRGRRSNQLSLAAEPDPEYSDD